VTLIGLTGGIASGKSQVGRYLAELGAEVIDADRAAHETYAPGTAGYAALIEAFGTEIVAADGSIDRARLGSRVFNDPQALNRLTAIVWPLTRDLVEGRVRELLQGGAGVVAVEAALLFEAGWKDLFDEVWYVTSPYDAVLERLHERGLDDAAAAQRLAAATDPARARSLATRIIENDGDLEALREKVIQAWRAATGDEG
jgi:dephospho-CoA kinase